jgi:hypothetical protein
MGGGCGAVGAEAVLWARGFGDSPQAHARSRVNQAAGSARPAAHRAATDTASSRMASPLGEGVARMGSRPRVSMHWRALWLRGAGGQGEAGVRSGRGTPGRGLGAPPRPARAVRSPAPRRQKLTAPPAASAGCPTPGAAPQASGWAWGAGTWRPAGRCGLQEARAGRCRFRAGRRVCGSQVPARRAVDGGQRRAGGQGHPSTGSDGQKRARRRRAGGAPHRRAVGAEGSPVWV